ncbi:MAG: hypothetical protein IT539_18755 [Bradyrhizobiaceae bacterium]|nr:hypothetical protein [Bradyrhizobiaceae bacterium]
MSKLSEAGGVRNGVRAESNLGRQYRPIGIGAVAAAMTVTGGHASASEKENRGDGDDRIPQVSKAA